MKKNWLIRTKNNHILGPVSKEKINELISSGTIKGDDEICSGNGYWLFVREQELVEKYVVGDVDQGFNPVQEALPCDIVDFGGGDEDELEDSNIYPSSVDLAYPGDDLGGEEADDITKIGLNINDLDLPKTEAAGDEIEIDPAPDDVPVKKNRKLKKKKVKSTNKLVSKPKTSMTINFLYFLAFIFLIIAFAAFKYKNLILNQINKRVSLSLFPAAIAQDIGTTSKKKSGFHSLQ